MERRKQPILRALLVWSLAGPIPAAVAAESPAQEQAQFAATCQRNSMLAPYYRCDCLASHVPAERARAPGRAFTDISADVLQKHGRSCVNPDGVRTKTSFDCKRRFASMKTLMKAYDRNGVGPDRFCGCVADRMVEYYRSPTIGGIIGDERKAMNTCKGMR